MRMAQNQEPSRHPDPHHPDPRNPDRAVALLVLSFALLFAPSAHPAQSPPSVPDAEIPHKVDAVVYDRASSIASYSVQEQYSLYRNGESTPSAQETVQTTYTQAGGKQYTTIAQTGSSLLRSNVIDKIIAGEKEMSQPSVRESTWVTTANYDMQPEPGDVSLNGHTCRIIDLKPKRKSQHLFNGKAWVDASDYTVVRLAGIPSESPSFFAGNSTVTRDYEKVNGFSMATHAEAHSHNFLLGTTVLKIDYTNYQITLKSPTPASNQPVP